MLTVRERRELLRLARLALVARLGADPPSDPDSSSWFMRSAGAFVTLRRRGVLRGCIGYTGSDEALTSVVVRCAVAAALEDPRFEPLSVEELSLVDLEISVLGPFERVTDMASIEIGRHGVVVEDGRRQGLLLPQVAMEWRWGRETFLAQTCVKAGLPIDAWRRCTVYRFEAEVFGERDTSAAVSDRSTS